jgi:hypothetical protein
MLRYRLGRRRRIPSYWSALWRHQVGLLKKFLGLVKQSFKNDAASTHVDLRHFHIDWR